uniref:Cell division control protein 45-like protein n=2 Tax=Mesocestoides corti TaxID=53468 RepID=A0A5K3EVZ6_MESCO
MGILSDFRDGFFNRIVQEHVLIFVTPDVDGVCAWRILRHLLRQGQVLYTLIVVSNKVELCQQFCLNKDKFDHIVLINCGANFDVLEVLEPPDQSIFYICDSHRPIHVNNFYNQRQINLITLNENTDDIPKFEDIYNDDLTDNSEGSEDEGDRQRNRMLAAEKRISRRRWERRKQEILIEYESFSYYTTSSAVVLFDLAWRLSQDSHQLLWCAIVGQTSQLMLNKTNRDHYIDQIEYLQSHVNRLGHSSHAQTQLESRNQDVSISFDEELTLWLYRHWSLKDALEITMLTSTRFKLFTEGGHKRLQEFLASIGLPRRDCAQKYSTMNAQVKNNLNLLFLQFGDKFGLTRPELFLPSFILRLSYKTPLSALDCFWLTLAALEYQSSSDPTGNFHTAMENLTCWSMESLEEGMESLQGHLRCLVGQVRALLDTDEVVAFGPFLYVYVAKSSLLSQNHRNPQVLSILARYILSAKAATRNKVGRSKRIVTMPLVLCVDSKVDENYLYIIGIPPLHGDDDRNIFGQVFDVAVKRTKARADFRHFDSNCIELHREDMLKFFEALASLLSS